MSYIWCTDGPSTALPAYTTNTLLFQLSLLSLGILLLLHALLEARKIARRISLLLVLMEVVVAKRISYMVEEFGLYQETITGQESADQLFEH